MPSLYNDLLVEKGQDTSPGYLVPVTNFFFKSLVEKTLFSEHSLSTAAVILSDGVPLLVDLIDSNFFPLSCKISTNTIPSINLDEKLSNFTKYDKVLNSNISNSNLINVKTQSNFSSINLHSQNNFHSDPDTQYYQKSYFSTLNWHPSSPYLLAFGGIDGSIQLIDYRLNKNVADWSAHIGKCIQLSFLKGSAYSNILVTAGSADGWFYFWDIRKIGSCLKGIQINSGLNCMAISKDSSLICFSNKNGDLQLMGLPLDKPLDQLGFRPSKSTMNSHTNLEFSENGSVIMMTGTEETSNRMFECTGISSTSICEVWNLQEPQNWAQMSNPSSFWTNLVRFSDTNTNKMKELINIQKKNQPKGFIERTCWGAFPRGLLLNSCFLKESISITEKPYILFENSFFGNDDVNTTENNFYDSEDEQNSEKNFNSIDDLNEDFNFPSVDIFLMKAIEAASLDTFNSEKERQFCCCLLGDMIVGVGGPSHTGGALKIWDASGFTLSATICEESKDLMTSISSSCKNNSFLLSSGWDQKKDKGRLTLWGYTVQEQLKNLYII